MPTTQMLLLALLATGAAALCSTPSSITSAPTTVYTNADGTYSDTLMCSWVATAPAGMVPVLTFTAFSTEDGVDFFRVYDGDAAIPDQRYAFSGSAVPQAVAANGPAMYITFTADGEGSNYSGVQATVSFENASLWQLCSMPWNITAPTVIGTTVGASRTTYIDNEACNWTVTGPAGMVPVITVTALSTEAGADFFVVYNGESDAAAVLGRFSGAVTPPVVAATGAAMYITFNADGQASNYRGVEATVKFENASVWQLCSMPSSITAAAVIGTNVGMSRATYIDNQVCSWTVTAPSGWVPVITVTALSTEAGRDYLDIYNGASDAAHLMGRLSGAIAAAVVVHGTGREMYVTFTADGLLCNFSGVTATVSFSAAAVEKEAGTVWCAPTGGTWQPSTASGRWVSVTFGNGLFVAVASSGAVMTSRDGMRWGTAEPLPGTELAAVAFGNGVFVAVGGTGDVMTSRNGSSWETSVPRPAVMWNAVAFGSGRFVAAADADNIMTSADGTEWTNAAVPASLVESWESIAFGAGVFVAVGYYGNVMTSETGGAWVFAVSVPFSVTAWQSVAFGNGRFVAVAYTGEVMTSATGAVWASATGVPLPTAAWSSVTFGDGVFVAVAWTGQMMTSASGSVWARAPSLPVAADTDVWSSCAFGDGVFVAVAFDGSVASSATACAETESASTEMTGAYIFAGVGVVLAAAAVALTRVGATPI